LRIENCGFKEFPEEYKNLKSKIRNPKYGKSPTVVLGATKQKTGDSKRVPCFFIYLIILYYHFYLKWNSGSVAVMFTQFKHGLIIFLVSPFHFYHISFTAEAGKPFQDLVQVF